MKERALRVLVDARMMLGRFSGVSRYVTRLIDELAKLDGVEPVALCGVGGADRWLDRGDVQTIVSSFRRADRSASRRVEWDALYLRRIIHDSGADVFHATWNTGIPAMCRTPSVLTIHDLIPWHEQQAHFGTVWQRRCYTFAQRASAKRAALIATVSDHVRQDVIGTLGIDASKVRTIHNGVALPTRARGQAVPRRYVLYVGGHERRKNLAGLFRAMQAYWDRYPDRILLHLTGHPDTLDESARGVLDTLTYRDRVRFLGSIDDAELSRQYQSAVALMTLSLNEGFGLPALEAMAHGCPVIASRAASLPEVVGTAGVLVNPHAPAEVAVGLHRVISQPAERAALIDRGRARAAQFTWERVGGETRKLYELAVSPRPHRPIAPVTARPSLSAV